MEPLLTDALNAAVRNNISIYAIDSRGVSTSSFVSGGSSDASNSGRVVIPPATAATGGVYFHESNDLLKEFGTAVADGREYYLLICAPANPAQDGKYRKITVGVRDRNLILRAKEGYWAK